MTHPDHLCAVSAQDHIKAIRDALESYATFLGDLGNGPDSYQWDMYNQGMAHLTALESLVPGAVPVTPADDSPYGYCPICNAPGENRERRIDGNDRCKNGHCYPSKDALLTIANVTRKEGV